MTADPKFLVCTMFKFHRLVPFMHKTTLHFHYILYSQYGLLILKVYSRQPLILQKFLVLSLVLTVFFHPYAGCHTTEQRANYIMKERASLIPFVVDKTCPTVIVSFNKKSVRQIRSSSHQKV